MSEGPLFRGLLWWH